MSELRQDIRTHPRAAVLAAMLVVVVWLGVNWFDLATFDHGELPVATLLEWLALPCLAGAVAARAVGGNRGRLLAPVAGVLVILANLALMAYAFRDVNSQDHHVDWDLPLLFGLVGAVLGASAASWARRVGTPDRADRVRQTGPNPPRSARPALRRGLRRPGRRWFPGRPR